MQPFRLILLALTCATGCAAQPEAAPTATPVVGYDARPASALVFDSPLARNVGPIRLDRDQRAAAAYVGYDTGITTAYHSRTDDNFAGWDRWGGYFSRRTVVDRSGFIRQ